MAGTFYPYNCIFRRGIIRGAVGSHIDLERSGQQRMPTTRYKNNEYVKYFNFSLLTYCVITHYRLILKHDQIPLLLPITIAFEFLVFLFILVGDFLNPKTKFMYYINFNDIFCMY